MIPVWSIAMSSILTNWMPLPLCPTVHFSLIGASPLLNRGIFYEKSLTLFIQNLNSH